MNESSEPVLNETAPAYVVSSQTARNLEFPDWNGQRDRSSNLSMDEMLRYCEAMLPSLRSKPGYEEIRLKARCEKEFVL